MHHRMAALQKKFTNPTCTQFFLSLFAVHLYHQTGIPAKKLNKVYIVCCIFDMTDIAWEYEK